MTCIVLLLIIVTIAFEIFKDEMEEEASRNMKPIVNKLFAELTVLGFLSIAVFIVTRAGFFATLSLVLFHDTTTLPAIFDFVHYTIFFVMVLFVFQVFVLVKEAMKLEKIWLDMEKTVQNPDAADNLGEAASDYFDKTLRRKKKRFSKIREMRDLMPVIRKKQSQTDEDMLLYKNLRDEFILERSIEPPFEPAPILTQVGPDFNFGKYLSLCLSQMLIHVVEINVVTWMFAACATVTYYVYGLMVDLDVKVRFCLFTVLVPFVGSCCCVLLLPLFVMFVSSHHTLSLLHEPILLLQTPFFVARLQDSCLVVGLLWMGRLHLQRLF